MRKRCFSILLAFCMALTLFPAPTLAEMPDAALEESPEPETAILNEAGDAMTRGAWMGELVKLFGLTLNKDEYPDVYFPDIAESEYFDDIMVATKFGLADVEAGDNFEPDKPLTRDFAAHTLNFYLGIQNERESYSYSDANDVTWRDDAQVAVDNEWFALSDGKFHPASEVTAEETASMLSFARSALNGRKIGESVSHYAFSSYVKELPSTVEIKSTLDIDSDVTTLEISGYSGTLAANDTIVFYSDGFAFVYGVASVTESDGVLTVVTKEAPDDAIEQFEQVGETQPELEPYLPEDNEPVSLMAADGEMVTFDRVELLDAGKHKISYKRDFNKNGLSGKLSAEVTDIALKTNFIGDKYVTLSGKITLSSTMELDFLNDDAAAQLFLGGIYIGKFGTLGLEINLKAAASIAYEYSAKFTVGVESLNGSKSLIHQLSASDTCITAKGTVSAKLALAARLEFGKVAKFYAGIGIGPTLSAKFKQYPSGTPQRCINLAGYLAADMEISAKLGKLKYEYTKDIYSESNSPLRVVEHIEDGVTVPACTRGKDSGTEESGYATPKYTTPTNSRYYASGVSNVSSTGYGGYGSAEPVVIWSTSDNGDGTVTITGYSGNASILNIPETIDGKIVTVIGNEAFQNKTGIRMVSIPDSVTSIGASSFQNCTNLTDVELSDSLTTLGDLAFYNTGITSVELPEGLLTMGTYWGEVFAKCAKLESARIPSTIETVHASNHGIFWDCVNLNSITFADGITTIFPHIFKDCPGLTHIDIPDTVTSIGERAFNRCSNLQIVNMPDTVTSIGEEAFRDCTNLTDAELSDSLTALGDRAFYNTGIMSVKLPESLLTMGTYWGEVFAKCGNLKSVYISNSVEILTGMFADCSSLENIQIPNGITTIKERTFQGCSSLKNVDFIPHTVTSINRNAFDSCTGLVRATIPNPVSSLDENIFKGCTSLTSFTAGTDLRSIGNNCFQDCVALSEVSLNDRLTTIGGYAFQNCAALETIVLPDSVTSIGTYAFQKDAALKNVTLSSGLTQIPSYAFANCTSMMELEIPGGVTTIKDHAFYQDTKLKTFVIPASVSKIEDNAFSYPTTTTVYGVSGSYAETYAKWAAFLDIVQYRKTGTMGDAQELQWTYAPDAKTVTVTGSVSANEPVYVGSYDANGKMLSVKMITASNGTAQADDGANTVMLFWLDSNFMPKCGKATIRNV